MITSFALIFLLGLISAYICKIFKIPPMIGMLITGVVLGPFGLNLLAPSILNISEDLREIALIIILIQAGLSLNVLSLKSVGIPAVLMSFVPAVFEIIALILLGPIMLNISILEASIIGAVLGAVSPAIVVPKMVELMRDNYGTDKDIPQLILAGSSLDDVFVIVLFSTFVSMARGGSAKILDFVEIPIEIILGIVLGIIFGLFLSWFFETAYAHEHCVRNSVKVIIVLACAFLLMTIETLLKNICIPISGLLAIMSMACVLRIKNVKFVTERLSEKFGKLWIATELVLFVLIGAAVNIKYTFTANIIPIIGIILFALIFRSLGVLCCLIKTKLNYKERLFCIIAYIPKATVQAVIGAVPLAIGLPCGELVLSVAVVSIIITAPLGAIGMDFSYKKLLKNN